MTRSLEAEQAILKGKTFSFFLLILLISSLAFLVVYTKRQIGRRRDGSEKFLKKDILFIFASIMLLPVWLATTFMAGMSTGNGGSDLGLISFILMPIPFAVGVLTISLFLRGSIDIYFRLKNKQVRQSVDK